MDLSVNIGFQLESEAIDCQTVTIHGVQIGVFSGYSSLKEWIYSEFNCWGSVDNVSALKPQVLVYGIANKTKYLEVSRQLDNATTIKGELFGVPCLKSSIAAWSVIHSPHRELLYFISKNKKKIYVLGKDKAQVNLSVSCCVKSFITRNVINKGWVLFHSAGIAYNNKGILILGDSGKGKTSLALLLGSCPGFSFMASDKCYLHIRNGSLWAYAIPQDITIGLGLIKAFGWGGEVRAHIDNAKNQHPANHENILTNICADNFLPIYRDSGREYKYNLLATALVVNFKIKLLNQTKTHLILLPFLEPGGIVSIKSSAKSGRWLTNSSLQLKDEEFMGLISRKQSKAYKKNAARIGVALSRIKCLKVALSHDVNVTRDAVRSYITRNNA